MNKFSILSNAKPETCNLKLAICNLKPVTKSKGYFMEFLSGLHPKVVHFSISFFVLYFIFESAGIILKKEYLIKSAYIILIFGIISSVFSVLTGNLAYQDAKLFFGKDAHKYNYLIEIHEQLATISLWYFTIVFFLRTYLTIKKKFSLIYQWTFVIFGFIGALLIVLTGYYGGQLVFDYGIGTKLFGK